MSENRAKTFEERFDSDDEFQISIEDPKVDGVDELFSVESLRKFSNLREPSPSEFRQPYSNLSSHRESRITTGDTSKTAHPKSSGQTESVTEPRVLCFPSEPIMMEIKPNIEQLEQQPEYLDINDTVTICSEEFTLPIQFYRSEDPESAFTVFSTVRVDLQLDLKDVAKIKREKSKKERIEQIQKLVRLNIQQCQFTLE